jgi:hypothetical protein
MGEVGMGGKRGYGGEGESNDQSLYAHRNKGN